MKKLILPIVTVSLICGCTNLSDRKQEQPFVISTIDLNEASFVRQVLKNTPEFKGKFRVEAGQTTTTAKFNTPLTVDENMLRENMKQIKVALSERRGREANTLIFIFTDKTVEE